MENIRKEARELIKLVIKMYPASKLFVVLVDVSRDTGRLHKVANCTGTFDCQLLNALHISYSACCGILIVPTGVEEQERTVAHGVPGVH